MQFPTPIISNLNSKTDVNFKVEKPVVALVILIIAILLTGSFLLMIPLFIIFGDAFDWIR